MPRTGKEKWKVHNMRLVGPGNVRILADCAQKSPQTLLWSRQLVQNGSNNLSLSPSLPSMHDDNDV